VGVTTLTPDQERKRKSIAVGICLLSAVLALVAWRYGTLGEDDLARRDDFERGVAGDVRIRIVMGPQ
jgi:hypothetical protein